MTTYPQAAWDLAARAADRITGRRSDPSVARAILAQWTAEHGYQWPFSRNNPGNLARRWAQVFPFAFSVQFPNPQPGNPIVTYGRLQDGADAYAAGLVAFPRYAAAVGKARAGDGLGFAVAVCQAGFGTRESAVRTVYAALRAPVTPGPGPTPGGSNVAIRYSQVTATRTRLRLRTGTALFDRPGGVRRTAIATTADVPHIGLAGSVDGHAWRAVVVGTAWSYSDGKRHATVLYVPASAGEVITP